MKDHITEERKKQIEEIIENIVNQEIKSGFLNQARIEKLLKKKEEFEDYIINGIIKFSNHDEFENEEVESNFSYPEEYRIKEVDEQVEILKRLLPQLSDATYDRDIIKQPLPEGSEGWFAIPRSKLLSSTYSNAVDLVLSIISLERGLINYCLGKFKIDFLRRNERTMKMLKKISDKQKQHRILIIPCQFGINHRGRSVRRVREILKPNEFGLGVFEVACLLLTHPEREIKQEQLHLYCPGDDFAIMEDIFCHALSFNFLNNYGFLNLNYCWYCYFYEDYGSATGFFCPY
mgnify:CR=1 FL=1